MVCEPIGLAATSDARRHEVEGEVGETYHVGV